MDSSLPERFRCPSERKIASQTNGTAKNYLLIYEPYHPTLRGHGFRLVSLWSESGSGLVFFCLEPAALCVDSLICFFPPPAASFLFISSSLLNANFASSCRPSFWYARPSRK